MRKIDPQRLFNGLITWINWMPKLILLQFLWLVCSLPFFTVATATRSMIAAIKQIKDTQERAEQEKTTTIFFTKFSELWQLNKKKDIVFNFYSLFLLIDHSILSRFPQPLFQVMATMLIVIFMICSLIFFYQTLLMGEKKQQVSFFYAFYQAGRSPKRVLLHLFWTITLLLFFGFFGPAYLFLVGMSGCCLIQLIICPASITSIQISH
ncbi:conserved hypothetical protein [Enterococcus gallinarum EG2]|uniref:DUF624 domain-containing protein n=1 Tax=Enterococcus gallinarum TaxID=1353 RepID=UPI0001B6B12E|nr:DUF624 domain-containing protein [Enterococcus gallinarum]EEV31807.1 conserved hypothetical protein [Enterococcus gallinarum EG2]